MLPNTAATMRQSSVAPTAGTKTLMMMDGAATLLEGVASTLETLLTVNVVKGVWVSKRCVLISGTLLTGEVTSDDCDDGVSAECVDTVKQFLDITVLSELQHAYAAMYVSSLVQIVQSLLLANVILMMSDGSLSFTSTVRHQLFSPVMV